MKHIKYIVLLLMTLLYLTGCDTNTYEYKGNKAVYELVGDTVDDINANGANIVVRDNQVFVELTKKDYDLYKKGEHKIDKKDKFYQYYFLSLKEFEEVKYGSKDPVTITDGEYGDLKINYYGIYDYQISDIKKFMKAYINDSKESVVGVEGYVNFAVVDAIGQEIIKSGYSHKELSRYVNKFRDSAVKTLESKGISCANFKIESISLANDSEEKVKKIDTNSAMSKLLISNTTWIAGDDSEIQFTDNEFKWYQNKGEYSDNFQYGNFKFFIDDMAVEYITTNLKSYGVTSEELDKLFASDDDFDVKNFVVFEINLVGYTIGGQSTEVNQSIYWYGFILRDNQNLQVVNMTTATYYNFFKKSV